MKKELIALSFFLEASTAEATSKPLIDLTTFASIPSDPTIQTFKLSLDSVEASNNEPLVAQQVTNPEPSPEALAARYYQ